MKIKIPKKWYKRMVEKEGDCEVGAGCPSSLARPITMDRQLAERLKDSVQQLADWYKNQGEATDAKHLDYMDQVNQLATLLSPDMKCKFCAQPLGGLSASSSCVCQRAARSLYPSFVILKDSVGKDILVLHGRAHGMDARRFFNIYSLDSDTRTTVVIIPDSVVSINSSFFAGMFLDSMVKLGESKFREKYQFESKNELTADIEAGIAYCMSWIHIYLRNT